MQSWNCLCDVGVRAPWSNIPGSARSLWEEPSGCCPSHPAPAGPCSSSQPLFLQPQCPGCSQTLGSAPPAVPAAALTIPRDSSTWRQPQAHGSWDLAFPASPPPSCEPCSWQRMRWIVSTETFLTRTTRGSQSQGILGAFL